ncbi:MAG: ATP synthase F1 subunit delta [Bacteroidota bacterium]
MSIARIAHRFAKAILDAVPEKTDSSDFFKDLQDVQSSIHQSHELLLFFQSPVISQIQKRKAVDALFSDRVSAYTLEVLRFLVEKEREAYVVEIIEAVFELYREREGIVTTTINSAVAMTTDQQTTLNSALERMSGKRVEAKYGVDDALLGGLTVRLGDTIYDGSVRHQLKRLRDRFVSGA